MSPLRAAGPLAVALLLLAAWLSPAPRCQAPAGDAASVAEWLQDELDRGPQLAEWEGIERELLQRLDRAGVELPVARALTDRRTDEQPEAAMRRAQRRIARYADAGEREAPELPSGSRAALTRILEDEQFDVEADEADGLELLTRRLMEWIGRQVSAMLGFLGGGSSWFVILVLAILAVTLLFGVLRWLALRSGTPSRTIHFQESRHQSLLADATPRRLLEAARDELAGSRLLAAMRLVERAAISALQQRGLLPRNPGLTDRESLAALRDDGESELRQSLDELVSIHERAVYAGQQASRELAGRAIDLGEAIVGAAGADAEGETR